METNHYGEVIAAALIAGGLALAGWLVRMALGETLRGIRDSLGGLRLSVSELTDELRSVKKEIGEHASRLAVVEDRFSRLEK